ncbi:MAG: hypothetical protein MI923_07450 [Phycisphaerales bacterium]|nr:hypothetical protein [Phycisphaerales bacterium]
MNLFFHGCRLKSGFLATMETFHFSKASPDRKEVRGGLLSSENLNRPVLLSRLYACNYLSDIEMALIGHAESA